MKPKESFSKTAQARIMREAKRHKRKGVVVYLNFKSGQFGYQGRIYKFPGAYGEKDRRPGKFNGTKFFALVNYGTWAAAAEAAAQWVAENQPKNGKTE